MYIRTVKKQIMAHPLINLMIIIQMCVVFVVTIFTISAVEAKLRDYYIVKDLLESDGLFCGGLFLSPEKEGEQMKDTDYIKSNLKNVDFVSTISFSGFQTGVDENNIVESAYTLIYDDYSANLYKPRMADGVWITECSDDCEYPQAVITENPFGYKVGDVIKIDGDEKEQTIKIIGIIGDNEKYLAANSSDGSREQPYTVLFDKHFNKIRDAVILAGRGRDFHTAANDKVVIEAADKVAAEYKDQADKPIVVSVVFRPGNAMGEAEKADIVIKKYTFTPVN